MGTASAQLVYELGYDPDDGVPDVADVEVEVGEMVRARDGAVQVAVARLGSGRLVVVVDECAVVLERAPELHRTFADIAARGRSLGVHLVLCTQRPVGVVAEHAVRLVEDVRRGVGSGRGHALTLACPAHRVQPLSGEAGVIGSAPAPAGGPPNAGRAGR